MNENNENLSGQWAISLGFYPGVLIGMRSYRTEGLITHVLYFPFVDVALQIFK
jgi:hypothetical protein